MGLTASKIFSRHLSGPWSASSALLSESSGHESASSFNLRQALLDVMILSMLLMPPLLSADSKAPTAKLVCPPSHRCMWGLMELTCKAFRRDWMGTCLPEAEQCS